MNELEALLILNHLSYIGPVKSRLLIQHYGSAIDAIRAPLAEIAVFPGFTSKVMQAWERGIKDTSWQVNLDLAEKLQASIIPYTSPQYPKRLLEIPDHPLVLYTQGEWCKQDQRCLAVIGTRNASLYGQEMAHKISRELAQAGYTIVSGLARGIDTAAHLGALEAGRTLAILGSGLARLYPAENAKLAEAIRQKGRVISEFAMDTPPDRQNFPQRNRIVSAMTMGTILIEAPCQSGAMLTVNRALNCRRPIFVLPGRVDWDSFKGNHALIKEGKAKLIENTQDILNHFEDLTFPFDSISSKCQAIPLEKEEKELLIYLPQQELSIEELVTLTKWPIAKLNVLLMSLVLKKVIKEYPGKIYKKIG